MCTDLEVVWRDAALVVAVAQQVDGFVDHLGVLEAADDGAERDEHAAGVRAHSCRLAHRLGTARVQTLKLGLRLRKTIKQPAIDKRLSQSPEAEHQNDEKVYVNAFVQVLNVRAGMRNALITSSHQAKCLISKFL